MSDSSSPTPSREEPSETERTERRRLRAAVFGDVLPDATTDERGAGWSDRDDDGGKSGGEDPTDEWLRREVPPHHG